MKKQRYKLLFEKSTLSIPLSNAYWISPYGKIIDVVTNHMAEIIKNPKPFGLTLSGLKTLFKKYKEPFGSEGNAREKLFLDLFKATI